MTPEEAYRILGLDPSATEAERTSKMKEQREALEAKLARAPTAGLKEKYRKHLQQLETAAEVLESSEDGSSLPTLAPEAPIEPPKEVVRKALALGSACSSAAR
ncbi:MAG: hypothetical protein ACPGN3_03675 [Opitutales bacterium]